MESTQCPRRLIHNGRWVNFAGAGRSPGSYVYIDPGRGDVLDLYFVKVVSLGPQFGLAAVANNAYLPCVRVNHALLNGAGPLRLGQVLLVGPLVFEPAGPRAQGAWPVACRTRVQHATIRKLGIITAVKGGFGFLQPADGSPDQFFHFSQCHGFVPVVGMTVEFALGPGSRGGTQAIGLRPL